MRTAEIGIMLKKISRQLDELESRSVQVSTDPIYLSISEAAKFTTFAASTLYTMVRKRRVPFVKKGGKICFEKNTLIAWMNESHVEPKVSPKGMVILGSKVGYLRF